MIAQTVDFEPFPLPFKKRKLSILLFPPTPELLFFFKWGHHWELQRDAQGMQKARNGVMQACISPSL